MNQENQIEAQKNNIKFYRTFVSKKVHYTCIVMNIKNFLTLIFFYNNRGALDYICYKEKYRA